MKTIKTISVLIVLFFFFFTAINATIVTLRLVDQYGELIPGSAFNITSVTVQQEDTISLAPGTYTVGVFPGINGASQTTLLSRQNTVVVSGLSQTVDFIWKTSNPELHVVDQSGDDIPESIIGINFLSFSIPTGTTVLLPVTEDPEQSPNFGAYANGYIFVIAPGINGVPSGCCLLRRIDTIEVAEPSPNIDFIWKTSNPALHVINQDGEEIPQSYVGDNFHEFNVATGTSVLLPVTEDPEQSPIFGAYANGYIIGVDPGINGVFNNGTLLSRLDTIEVAEPSPTIDFVWKTSNPILRVVNQEGEEIPQSYIGDNFHEFNVATGTSVLLPVTEDPEQSPIFGWYANGYIIGVAPGINGVSSGCCLLRRLDTIEVAEPSTTIDFIWKTVNPVLRVVNQDGDEIPQSYIGDNFHEFNVATGTSVLLPVTEDPEQSPIFGAYANGYIIGVAPGINGVPSGCCLIRRIDTIEVAEPSPTIDFKWKTSNPELHVVDQSGDDIPESIIGINFLSFSIPTGTPVLLPVTEDPEQSPIFGAYANGYIFVIAPGINGVPSGCCLLRRIDTIEVAEPSPTIDFVWETIKGLLHVVDIAEKEVCETAFGINFLSTFPTSTHMSLPVTDPDLYPGIFGQFSNGYDIIIKANPGEPFSQVFNSPLLSSGVFDPSFVEIDGTQYGLRFNLDECDLCEGCTTPEAICALMNQQIIDLLGAGFLNKGQANSLLTKINNACNMIGGGNITPAINILNAFIKEVNGLMNGEVLSPEHGQQLIDSANELIALIQENAFIPVIQSGSPFTNELDQRMSCYPNPFASQTEIQFNVWEASEVELAIFNIHGMKVKTLVREYHEPGQYTTLWDTSGSQGENLNSGMYICRLATKKEIRAIKLNLLR